MEGEGSSFDDLVSDSYFKLKALISWFVGQESFGYCLGEAEFEVLDEILEIGLVA